MQTELNDKANLLSVLFDLIKSEITNKKICVDKKVDFKEMFSLSKKHDLSHLVFDAAIKNGLIDEGDTIFEKANKEVFLAIFRYEQQNADLTVIKRVFNKNRISFVPLKGSILREYYPKPWMRTSCDIDILIHSEDLEKAKRALIQVGFTTNGELNYHEVSFFKGSTHLELHYNICEANKQLDPLLSKIWDYVEQFYDCEYRETKSYFVFHHIAHMAYHFLTGGCGIRPLLDLWILNKSNYYDKDHVSILLRRCNLSAFYKNACDLSEVWFGNKEHTSITFQMEKCIIQSGIYGTSESGANFGLARHKGSKIKYLLSIVFPPYEIMLNNYPTLSKRKLLLPFFYVHRFFSKVFGGRGVASRKRLKAIGKVSKKDAKEKASLIKELGLS